MTLEKSEHVINTVVNSPIDLSVLSLISSSDIFGKFIILSLVSASICTWAIIISKSTHLCYLKTKIKLFENLFWSTKDLDELYTKIKTSIDNPLSAVFVSAISEYKKNSLIKNQHSEMFKVERKKRIVSSMYLSRNREIEKLDNKLGFLATTGSAAPFVGLLGTVWGIIHSFHSIAVSKNTSLAVVAPGIAEALIVTAIGLLTAIPATIAYNYLILEVQNIESRINNFIGEFNILISKIIDEEKT